MLHRPAPLEVGLKRKDMRTMLLLSPKHGVNPSINVCFYCGKPKEVLLLGRLKGDKEAPRQAVFDMEPCDECRSWMEQGIIFISVRDGETNRTNPHRTGGWAVIKEKAVQSILPKNIFEKARKARFVFIEDTVWEHLGLPGEEEKTSQLLTAK